MIGTNVPGVSAKFRTINGRTYLELSGDIDKFDSVDVDSIAEAAGYAVGFVVDESTMECHEIEFVDPPDANDEFACRFGDTYRDG